MTIVFLVMIAVLGLAFFIDIKFLGVGENVRSSESEKKPSDDDLWAAFQYVVAIRVGALGARTGNRDLIRQSIAFGVSRMHDRPEEVHALLSNPAVRRVLERNADEFLMKKLDDLKTTRAAG